MNTYTCKHCGEADLAPNQLRLWHGTGFNQCRGQPIRIVRLVPEVAWELGAPTPLDVFLKPKAEQ